MAHAGHSQLLLRLSLITVLPIQKKGCLSYHLSNFWTAPQMLLGVVLVAKVVLLIMAFLMQLSTRSCKRVTTDIESEID